MSVNLSFGDDESSPSPGLHRACAYSGYSEDQVEVHLSLGVLGQPGQHSKIPPPQKRVWQTGNIAQQDNVCHVGGSGFMAHILVCTCVHVREISERSVLNGMP